MPDLQFALQVGVRCQMHHDVSLGCGPKPHIHHLQVPAGDNYYAALNCAVFSDGSFVYIPKGVKCPMELSTYFRINAQESGQVCHSAACLLRHACQAVCELNSAMTCVQFHPFKHLLPQRLRHVQQLTAEIRLFHCAV